ncbi:MAG TPA: 1-acyl-sn-glycerol-3-phosphate acyltransferase [Bacillus bacterium]|uniref:lysophospholipid acyltransferase family protein n=1 Tax=Siminovitchia fordii TaxID=254759 RepID=UPI000364D5BB|nr:lysophospholipid acyltransferase family protein [Siminovitchia fordii]HBZ09251.1 1-acyl-sn-glycerol-3-phosphate acyltransferase [Bacillus sp. (in: firmicutes)]
MYKFIVILATIIFRILGKVEVKNKDILPSEGGFILTCTHKGWLDVVILGICTPRPIHFMAKKELFNNKLTSHFLTKIKAFPVNRDSPSLSSIKMPIKLLKSGEVVGIFPGGTRTTEDVSLKRGAVTLANLAKVPIVPAVYEGPANLKELWKARKATIIFGEPFFVNTNSKDEIVEFTDHLSEEINKLKTI